MSDGERTIALFFGAYALTGVALFTGMFLGHKGRVKGHILAIVLFLALFVVTIYFAEMTGRFYKFDEQREKIHLPLAYLASGATLLPLATGWRKWRGRGSLFAHRAAVVTFLVAFVAATVTGVLMLLTRAPR